MAPRKGAYLILHPALPVTRQPRVLIMMQLEEDISWLDIN
jgi:hypothetical protein